MTVRTSKVVQVTNIAPQVTKDQMHVLFSFLGKIEDIRLYPTMRDASYPVQSRICYIKFVDASTVPVAQHMTNAVFIDRALIVIPMSNEEIPDECYVLEMTKHGTIVPGLPVKDPKLPSHVVSSVYGSGEGQVIVTTDTNLDLNDLPPYPPLPASFDPAKIEESRRTILMLNYNPAVTTDEVIDFLRSAGEVKYLRTCKRDSDESINMLVEFTDQPSVVNALKMNGMDFKGTAVEIQHATQPITKPQSKSNETAQLEIEEAASMFKLEQYMMDATKEPDAKVPTKNERRSRSRSSGRRHRSRSRSRSRRRSSSRKRGSPSRSRRSSSRRRGRSRASSHSRRGSKSRRRRSRSRRGSRSGDRKKRSTSTSRNGSSRRNRSTSRIRNLKSKERSSRIQSRDKERDRSKDRKRSRDKDVKSRKRNPSKEKERGKDECSSSSRAKRDTETIDKSVGGSTSEKRVSRSRSRSRSSDRKKRDRKRSRSGGSKRRSPSPRISKKRENRSRSRGIDRKRDRRDKDRKDKDRRSKSRSRTNQTLSSSKVPRNDDEKEKEEIGPLVIGKGSSEKSDMDISNSS